MKQENVENTRSTKPASLPLKIDALEDDSVPFWSKRPIFRGENVSFREGTHEKMQRETQIRENRCGNVYEEVVTVAFYGLFFFGRGGN